MIWRRKRCKRATGRLRCVNALSTRGTLASMVFPLPGLPYSSTPRAGPSRLLRNISGNCSGRTTQSICRSKPLQADAVTMHSAMLRIASHRPLLCMHMSKALAANQSVLDVLEPADVVKAHRDLGRVHKRFCEQLHEHSSCGSVLDRVATSLQPEPQKCIGQHGR